MGGSDVGVVGDFPGSGGRGVEIGLAAGSGADRGGGLEGKVGGICARERTMAGEAVSAHAREAAVCGRACISMAGGAGPVARVAGIRVYCGGVWAMVAGVVCVAAFLAENGESVHHGVRPAHGVKLAGFARGGATDGE